MQEIEIVGDGWSTAPLARGRQLRLRLGAGWAVWAAVAANAAAIVWLWVHGGNLAALHGAGDALTSLGRLTGLLGAYLALVQVLMLSRLPPLERLAGFDRLTVWHRLNGKVCLGLVLAHVVFITLGYAASDRIAIPREVSALLTSYPGMVAATVGTALMIVVVVASLVVIRQRLPYEGWYAVHITAYASIALGWFHQVPTGNELSADTLAADYWTSLYLATLALLLLYRFVYPVARAFRHRIRVSGVSVEGPGVVSVHMTGRKLDRLNARAGQFFLWRFLSRGRWWAAHPFSLSAAPDGRSLRITVKAVGDFTGRIGTLAPGTRVMVEGPFGVFTDAVRRHDRVALIAGGIGITPIRALAEELRGDLALVYCAMREDDLVFRSELEALAAERGLALHLVVGDHRGPDGARLLSPAHLLELVPDIAQREVYICGPPAMMQIAEQSARRAGVPPAFIHTERFAL